ncbi:MAG TPA: hypothetical protein VG227_10095 [Caulobacteraceae bacterium]|nr:hypothetical protein [Caulobacteraceae bacterium]
MDKRRQLAELKADRELFARFLMDCEERQAEQLKAGVEDAFRNGVIEYMDHLRGVIAELDEQIAHLEAGGGA